MQHVQHSIEASASAVASKVTGAGSAVTVVGWATSSNFGMWAGIVIGVLGLLVNIYFKHKEHQLIKERHAVLLANARPKAVINDRQELDE